MNKKENNIQVLEKEKSDMLADKKILMKDYFENKYGIFDYKVVSFLEKGWNQPYDILNIEIEFNGVVENVFIEMYTDDNEIEYRDSFFGLLIRDDLEKKIDDYAKEYFSDYKVYANWIRDISFPSEFSIDKGIDEIINNNTDVITFTVFVDENTFKNMNDFKVVANKFINDWKSEGISSTPRVIYVTHNDYLKIDRNSASDYLIDNVCEISEVIP